MPHPTHPLFRDPTSWFTIMDATSATSLPPGISATRLPSWLPPPRSPRFALISSSYRACPSVTTYQRLSHLLAAQSPQAPTLASLKSLCTIHLVEATFCSDDFYDASLHSKNANTITSYFYLASLLLDRSLPPPSHRHNSPSTSVSHLPSLYAPDVSVPIPPVPVPLVLYLLPPSPYSLGPPSVISSSPTLVLTLPTSLLSLLTALAIPSFVPSLYVHCSLYFGIVCLRRLVCNPHTFSPSRPSTRKRPRLIFNPPSLVSFPKRCGGTHLRSSIHRFGLFS